MNICRAVLAERLLDVLARQEAPALFGPEGLDLSLRAAGTDRQ